MLSLKIVKIPFLIIAVALAVIFGLIIILGYYPIAKINGNYIFSRNFSKIASGFLSFNQKTNQKVSADLIKEGVLLTIFEDNFAKKELEERGISQKMVEESVAKMLKNFPEEKLKESAKLYNWNTEEFSQMVLIPQARVDILADLLKNEEESYDDWMQEKFQSAEISLYFLPWRWNGKTLEKK